MEVKLTSYPRSRRAPGRLLMLFPRSVTAATVAIVILGVALGAEYDSTGSYASALIAAIPMCVASALLFILLGSYPRLDSAQEQD